MENVCVDRGRLWFADNVFSVQGGKTDGRLLLQCGGHRCRFPVNVPVLVAFLCRRRVRENRPRLVENSSRLAWTPPPLSLSLSLSLSVIASRRRHGSRRRPVHVVWWPCACGPWLGVVARVWSAPAHT